MPRWNAPALESLYELAQEFGDVAPLPAFGVPFFLFCHPEHIEEILRQKNRSFKKDRYLDALRPMLGNGLFTSEGETWRRQRAVARPLFAAQQIKEYAGIVVAFADRLIGTWQRPDARRARRHDGALARYHHQDVVRRRRQGHGCLGRGARRDDRPVYEPALGLVERRGEERPCRGRAPLAATRCARLAT